MKKKALALVWLLGMSGCFVDLDGHHRRRYNDTYYDDGYYTSFLHVYWTINGRTDPAECRLNGVTDISVLIETSSGAEVGEFLSDCRDFETEIELDPGRYYANAVLIDGRGEERSTQVDTDRISLGSDDYESVTIDFPGDAFF